MGKLHHDAGSGGTLRVPKAAGPCVPEAPRPEPLKPQPQILDLKPENP